MKTRRTTILRAAVLGLGFVLLTSSAHAVGKPSSPHISEGELELEYEAVGLIDSDDAKRKAKHEVEISYGVTDWFRPEVVAKYEDAGNESGELSTLGFGAQFVFIQPGTHWFDSAIRVVYEHKLHDDADELKTKLLLQKEYGNFRHRANVNVSQQLGDDAQAGGPEWSLVWSSRYSITPNLAAGFEYDGEFGQSRNFDRYSEQSHYIGPVLYGKLSDDLKVEAGYLFGISNAAADGAVRFAIEYGIEF